MNYAAVDRADVEGNAKNGPVVRLSFASLFDALGTCLKDESSVLLLYSLVHGNCDFQEYVLVRTDLDSLLMPIFEMLYDASRKTSNQIYMLLITLLILSQDSTFNASVHKLDVYLHTNCLVILAIMGPHAHRLSAYASRRLVSLFDMLPRKYAKLAELKNDNALKVMSDQIEADITSDDMFSSHNSFLSSRVGLGLAVQGSDAWHSKCEEYGFAEGVSTKAPATSDANASTNEDDTKTVSSNLSSSKTESTQLSSGTDVSPGKQKKLMIHKGFWFTGYLLLIILSMFLPSSEARQIVQLSESDFCSNHYLLSSKIAVACISTQPEPICCELLVPALDSKGCICKLMSDGTELDNFLMKYTLCGGQHPELLEDAQNCSSAPTPTVTEVAPTQKIPKVAIIASKPKNVKSLRWLLVLLLAVVLIGLLFWGTLELKKRREARRVGPQTQEVQLGSRVTMQTRQTADDSIRNQHVDIPILEDLPFLGPMTRSRFISVKDRAAGTKESTSD
ncbi:uncharacterized protein [Aegilops tauschii subsp. strangulata]|uniref:uncharacterized protein n=1 Tax=Aegilops tauschii subsp. strangulata TaxID=200361 RepID=UPI001E1CA28C|nr:uncharacterized protein LOC109742138 [Aegilops tauschii subsp. strangulata]